MRFTALAVSAFFGAAAAWGELPVGSGAEAATPARALVKLETAGGEPLAGEGFVVFKGAADAAPLVVPTKLPGSAAADLPPGSQWTLIADFPGYFASATVFRVPLDAGGKPIETRMLLRPAGLLTGRLTPGDKDKLPQGLEARFEPAREGPPPKQDVPSGVASCAVSPEGDWRCRLPAGRFDVALHPQGFVPHYLWNVTVTAGDAASLGSRKLVRGSSVAGWVLREDGTPAETCRVRLEPAAAPGRPGDPALEFLRTVAGEAACQKRGFFQLSAVAAGSYVLVAQEGEAQARMSPVEVWDGAESRITTPVWLRKPLDFEVTLSPPVDWLGRPWRFEARRADEYSSGWEEPSFRTEASLDGKVRIPRKQPGRFWFTVYDGRGNAIFSDLHVSLADPAQPYLIDLDLLWIEGTIHLGGEPVEARLFFGGRSGTTSIEMASDEDGRFEGPLPKPGSWLVDVEGAEPRLKASAKVEVESKDGRATVRIELPDTKVYGRVVDPDGEPAPGALVVLSSAISTLQTEADDKGEFELRAFPAGLLKLSAEGVGGKAGRAVSDSHLFQASEPSPHGPVVLALRRSEVLQGKVLAATGPVTGATVSAWPVDGGDGTVSTVRSGIDGGFEIRVPEGTRSLRVVLSPPAGALKSMDVEISPDSAFLLQVEPQGGELVVDVGKEDSLDGKVLALWQGGIGIPVGTLLRWAEGNGVRFLDGGRVRIPRLAAGDYTVCLGIAAVIDPGEIEEWKKSRATCASGYLATASSLHLRLD